MARTGHLASRENILIFLGDHLMLEPPYDKFFSFTCFTALSFLGLASIPLSFQMNPRTSPDLTPKGYCLDLGEHYASLYTQRLLQGQWCRGQSWLIY